MIFLARNSKTLKKLRQQPWSIWDINMFTTFDMKFSLDETSFECEWMCNVPNLKTTYPNCLIWHGLECYSSRFHSDNVNYNRYRQSPITIHATKLVTGWCSSLVFKSWLKEIKVDGKSWRVSRISRSKFGFKGEPVTEKF